MEHDMPRAYRLGERAASKESTRTRILEAAIELYTEAGISATSLSEIGRRADVAPGTLRNHFATREDLDRAMIARLTAEAPLPEISIFDGAATLEERLRRLILAAARFMEQAGRMYRMWVREPMLTTPWNEAGALYGGRWAELMAAAAGPLAGDDEAMTVLRAILDPPFLDAMRGRGERTTDEASRLIADVVVPWFVDRAARARANRSPVERRRDPVAEHGRRPGGRP